MCTGTCACTTLSACRRTELYKRNWSLLACLAVYLGSTPLLSLLQLPSLALRRVASTGKACQKCNVYLDIHCFVVGFASLFRGGGVDGTLNDTLVCGFSPRVPPGGEDT